MARNEFFGGKYNQSSSVPYTSVGQFLSISDNPAEPFYRVYSSGSRIRLANTTGIRFGNSAWTAGDRLGNSPSENATGVNKLPNGDIDLSRPYTITIGITTLPAAAGQLQVFVDNNTTTGSNSIHYTADGTSGGTPRSRLVQLAAPSLAIGTLIINVPGDVTMNGSVVATIANHVGTPTSFLAFRCPGNCGATNADNIPDGETDGSAGDPGFGANTSIELSSILVEYQDGGVLQAPLAPTSFPATPVANGDTELTVSWHIVGNTDAYDVGWSTTNDSSTIGGNVIADITGTSQTITGLINGESYFVFVRAKNAAGAGLWSAGLPGTPLGLPDAPDAPLLTAGDTQIQVEWNSVATATSYDVARNTSNSTEGATIVNVPSGTSTTLTSLDNGTEYWVFVRAKNAIGDGDWSDGASATPEAAIVPPGVPSGLALVAGDEQIEVSWDAVDGATGYDIVYNTSDANDPEATDPNSGEVLDIAGTDTVLTNLVNDTEYYVFIRAKNSAGDSNWSDSESATPTAPPTDVWTGAALDLLGSSTAAPNGSISVNTSSAVTINFNGGNLNTSNRRYFYAYQQLTGDFTFTARIVSVALQDADPDDVFTATSNAHRYGLLITENINAPSGGTYANLPRSAAAEFYTNSATPTFRGSRAVKLDVGGTTTQSRTDITEITSGGTVLAIGHYLRIVKTATTVHIQVSEDGITFTGHPASAQTLLNANDNPIADTWYAGFYGASTDHLTVVFDNVEIVQ